MTGAPAQVTQPPGAGGTDGVLIVDGMRPLDAVTLIERCGGKVYFAREAGDGSSVLDVHMDTPTANAVALEMYDYPLRYVSTAESHSTNGEPFEAGARSERYEDARLVADLIAELPGMPMSTAEEIRRTDGLGWHAAAEVVRCARSTGAYIEITRKLRDTVAGLVQEDGGDQLAIAALSKVDDLLSHGLDTDDDAAVCAVRGLVEWCDDEATPQAAAADVLRVAFNIIINDRFSANWDQGACESLLARAVRSIVVYRHLCEGGREGPPANRREATARLRAFVERLIADVAKRSPVSEVPRCRSTLAA